MCLFSFGNYAAWCLGTDFIQEHVLNFTHCFNFLTRDGCVTRIVFILMRTLNFWICCVTNVFTKAIPSK